MYYLFKWQREKQRKLPPLIHSPNYQYWPEPKPEAMNSVQGSHKGSRNPVTPLLPPKVYTSRKLESRPRLRRRIQEVL